MNHQELVTVKNLYDLEHTQARPLLESVTYPWEALDKIGAFILELGKQLDNDPDYEKRGETVWIHKTAKVWDSAYFGDNVIIGPNTEVRQCAFLRGNALVGADDVVGNSTELKNVIIFDHVEVPHYNYVGDAILGYHSHMGAGSITSNVKSDKTNVVIKSADGQIETGIKKIGAMLGDNVEVGCNSVLNPGTIVCRNSNIYPTSCVRGVVPEHSIWKVNGEIVQKNI